MEDRLSGTLYLEGNQEIRVIAIADALKGESIIDLETGQPLICLNNGKIYFSSSINRPIRFIPDGDRCTRASTIVMENFAPIEEMEKLCPFS